MNGEIEEEAIEPTAKGKWNNNINNNTDNVMWKNELPEIKEEEKNEKLHYC